MLDGLVYLLVIEDNRSEYVARYTANEMAEVFTAEEVVLLATQGKVNRYRKGTAHVTVAYVNMVFAARNFHRPDSAYQRKA